MLKALREKLPEYSFIYFGDTARTPYGNKSPETITRYGREDAKLLLDMGAKLIVIGCNTVSAVAAEMLRNEFSVPVFEVIKPAVEEALGEGEAKNIGVIGTRATIKSGIYQKLLNENAVNPVNVYAEACPLFVPLVEEGWEGELETAAIVKKSLSGIKLKGIDTLILGCTHYPLLERVIQSFLGPGVRVVDSGKALAGAVKKYLEANPEIDSRMEKQGRVKVLVSDITDQSLELSLAQGFGQVDLEKANL